MFVVLYIANLCMCIYDMLHILLSLWHTWNISIYLCMYVLHCSYKCRTCTMCTVKVI